MDITTIKIQLDPVCTTGVQDAPGMVKSMSSILRICVNDVAAMDIITIKIQLGQAFTTGVQGVPVADMRDKNKKGGDIRGSVFEM